MLLSGRCGMHAGRLVEMSYRDIALSHCRTHQLPLGESDLFAALTKMTVGDVAEAIHSALPRELLSGTASVPLLATPGLATCFLYSGRLLDASSCFLTNVPGRIAPAVQPCDDTLTPTTKPPAQAVGSQPSKSEQLPVVHFVFRFLPWLGGVAEPHHNGAAKSTATNAHRGEDPPRQSSQGGCCTVM